MEHGRSIVVLDFGGQYAHLIARRVRQSGVFSEIKDASTKASELKGCAGIILSGGPQSVYDKSSPQGDPAIFDLGVPVLGICYGMQWMARALGGEVKEGKTKEYGKTKISTQEGVWRFESGIPKELTVWMSHGDEVAKLPDGFSRFATSDACANAGIYHTEKQFTGVQFHPEVTHTEYGDRMLANFVKSCDADPWSIDSYVEHISAYIKQEVGDKKVFMLVSGGVDSTVAFVLLNKVLGPDRVQGLYVDTGLMRKGETEEIRTAFADLGIRNLRIEDASEFFLHKLTEVYEPEQKRWIIGDAFLSIQKRVSEEMGLRMEDGWMLGQGTIYPDTIETGETSNADTIKTHHNRIEEIQRMMDEGLVVEPLRDLYKDEVRKLGEELSIPHDLVWRHPFPGPGLGVRILCTKEEESLDNNQLPISNNQYASCILPIKSVGVQGDGRSYKHAAALFLDAKYPDEATWQSATDIPNAHAEVNRVLMCTSHSEVPIFTSSPSYVTGARAEMLREADEIVNTHMRAANLYERIWQFPVVLLPFGTSEGGQSVVLRPVDSKEAMTANASRLPREVVCFVTEDILKIDGIDCVFYDLTNKPPGTIEWE